MLKLQQQQRVSKRLVNSRGRAIFVSDAKDEPKAKTQSGSDVTVAMQSTAGDYVP